MTISQNFIFVSLLVLVTSFLLSAASDVELQSEKISSNSSSVNSTVLESNVSLVQEQNAEEPTTSEPWEDDETTTYDEEETTTEKGEIETTIEEIEIEATTEEKDEAETTLAQDTTSEEVENTTENGQDLSTPQKEEDNKDHGDEIGPESGSVSTAGIIVVSILISFAGIFTGLYFLRGYLFRRRRDDQLKLLRSSEGFFHGSSFSFHDSI